MSTGPGRASTPLLAVDTGGTFTDLVLLHEGAIRTLKVPSTPADPSQAVLDGIREILAGAPGYRLLHGSTVATNALLERRGARVVLVTNEGFEDVIEIGRQDRPQLYALVGERLPPLVDRDDRLGVPGRLGPEGEEIAPLDPERLEALPAEIRARSAEAVAAVLLHSYADPAHERAVAEAIVRGLSRGEAGVAGEALPLSISSELVPEFREYERTSTTVMNAYVAPIMDRYLGRLAREAGAERVTIMGSNGGALPIDRARREVLAPSPYSKMVWENNNRRVMAGRPPLDWIVLRNRLAHIDARNKREIAGLMEQLAQRIGFRLAPGFGERVIFRELFLRGLTVLDIGGEDPDLPPNPSHESARQEVQGLLDAIGLTQPAHA